MTDWAVILGASSGIGKACALKLAEKGVNIFGIYLRRPKNQIEILTTELESFGIKVIFAKMSATNVEKRIEAIEKLNSLGNIRIKIFIHSLAFGALKPFIGDKPENAINQKQIEMTLDVMGNSLVYWCQDLFQAGLLKKGSQIFAANALMAGVTDTPALRKIPGNEKMIKHAISVNPHRRLTTPEDIGDAVSLIGLNESSWITGNTIRVDGGEDITA